MLISVVLDEVRFMGIDSTGERTHALILREKEGTRRCVLYFDEVFVHFIRAAQKNLHQNGVPAFHSAAMDLLTEAGYQLHHLVIPGLTGPEENKRFQTILHFQLGNRNIEKEFLPSDALAFALHADCPILMEDAFLAKADRQAAVVPPTSHPEQPVRPVQGSSESVTDMLLRLPKDKLPQA